MRRRMVLEVNRETTWARLNDSSSRNSSPSSSWPIERRRRQSPRKTKSSAFSSSFPFFSHFFYLKAGICFPHRRDSPRSAVPSPIFLRTALGEVAGRWRWEGRRAPSGYLTTRTAPQVVVVLLPERISRAKSKGWIVASKETLDGETLSSANGRCAAKRR